jgi:SAM-dependent methyltransferase
LPRDPFRLGLLRELSARLGQALLAADRLLLHVDVATRRLGDVQAAIRAYWSSFSADPDQPPSGLMVWEQSVLADWVHPGDRLLLIGCGSGRELHALVQRGCDVVGVEPAEETLSLARRVAAALDRPIELVHGFVEDVALPGDFDVCWFSYFAYSYIPDRSRRVALLRRLASHLHGGGRIVVTCLTQPHAPRSRAVALGRFINRLVGNDWQLAAGDVLIRAQPMYRLFLYEHVFTIGELERECAEAGLKMAAAFPPQAFVLVPAV